MNNKIVVAFVLGLALFAFVFAAYFYQQNEQQAQVQVISDGGAQLVRNHSPAIGNPMYRVTVVEFLDPECESCRVFHPKVKELLKKYENRIYYVVRYAPLHRYSKEAVAFLEAARLQGKYWETLDLLFERQPEWANHHKPKPQLKWTYLKELGLDEKKMRIDHKSQAIQKIIKLDMQDGLALQIRGTPSFFINGQPLQRFGAEYLDQAIAQALQD